MSFLFFLCFWIFSYRINNLDGEKLNIWIDENGNELKVPIIKVLKGNELTLITYFNKNDKNYIIFPEISGNYAEIYLNGNLIEKLGYGKDHLFNLYLKPHLLFLGNNLKEKNELKIVIFDLYKGGIKTTPVLINEKDLNKFSILKFINYGFISSLGGIIFFSIILVLDYLFFLKLEKKVFLYYLLSLILLLVSSRDFHYISLGNQHTYLIMKKIFFVFLLASFMFFIQTINTSIKKRRLFNYIIGILLLIPSLFYIFSKDVYTLMEYYNKFSIIPTIILFLLIILYRNIERYIFLFTFLACTILHDILLVYYPINGDRFLFQYGLFSYAIFIGFRIIEELKNANIKIEDYYNKAFSDPLTNSHNRFLLNHIKLTNEDTIVFFDLNDLKKINDNFGHEKGDEALIFVSSIVKKHIRINDYLIRYGGDEFIVIMKKCSTKIAKLKFLEIQEDLKKFEIPLSIAYGISKFNENLDKTLQIADMKMYKMKSLIKKNRRKKIKGA
ncbi:GGDEF domain-containing protein [Marinitoga sp. 38H-ov]|uniref:GGDEF domain-containing protein n=1 Tax=Marinitoga sp. 38H-ov TaxID=1755814 RepID=UPI0019D1F830|nr:GGDEF domain-containing protein [Marinitoga sp. 38H-ov]